MLSGSRLCNDVLLACALCKEYLSNSVVDLVGACVTEVFPFQIDLSTAIVLGQTVGKCQRCRPPRIFLKKRHIFTAE